MNRSADGFVDSRGVVLVASSSSLFMSIVGDMLTVCGFETAHPAASEAAWLSVTRTQPALVICDSGIPAATIKRLIAEVCTRHLPLLMAWPREEHDVHAAGLVLPDHAAWLTFPVDRDAFRATIDALVPPLTGPMQGLAMKTAAARTAAPDRPAHRLLKLLP